MLKAEFSDEALTECFRAAERILKRFGKADQNGQTTYSSGDLQFVRTNGNEIEIRFGGHVVLRALVDWDAGSGGKVIWQPGDWVQAVDAIDPR